MRSPKPGHIEIYRETNGEFFWRLRASNGQVLSVSSQGYSDKEQMLKDVVLMKNNIRGAEIVNKY